MPKIIPSDNEDQTCKLITKKLTLDMTDESSAVATRSSVEIMVEISNSCDDPECLLAAPAMMVAIPVGSFIVSGSIVVCGNVIHWVEQQGRCEESFTRKVIHDITTRSKNAGGHVIKTGKELIDWFQYQLKRNSTPVSEE